MSRKRNPSFLIALPLLFLSCKDHQATSASRSDSNQRTISGRLDRVIRKADATHESLLSFTETIFDDSLRQGKIVGCSAYRLIMLTGRRQLTDSELADFKLRLSTLVSPTKFIAFFVIDRDILIRVPPSVSYQRALGLKEVTFGYKYYSPWRLDSCREEFKAPIPNEERARNEERQRFAQMIVRARLRLEYYGKLLPEIEVKASRALSLKASLEAVKGDLSIDLNPEMTEIKVREYEDFLNAATETLSQWRREAALDTLVEAGDIEEVIAVTTLPAEGKP